MAWTRGLIESTVDALWTLRENNMAGKYGMSKNDPAIHNMYVRNRVNLNELKEIAEVLGKHVSKTPKKEFFVIHRGCEFIASAKQAK